MYARAGPGADLGGEITAGSPRRSASSSTSRLPKARRVPRPAWAHRALVQRRAASSAWPSDLQRPGSLLELPHSAHLQRARLQLAQAVRDLHRQLHRRLFSDRHVPDGTASRAVGAREGRLLPRWPLPHPDGGGRSLQQLLQPRLELRAESGPRPIPEKPVALAGWHGTAPNAGIRARAVRRSSGQVVIILPPME